MGATVLQCARILSIDHHTKTCSYSTRKAFSDLGIIAKVGVEHATRELGECDLVVHGRLSGDARGFVYGGGHFIGDRANMPPLSALELRLLALVPAQELTFTCVPRGSGTRMGIDHDLDGVLDGDE